MLVASPLKTIVISAALFYTFSMAISEELVEGSCLYIPGGVSSPLRAFRRFERSLLFVTCAEGAYLHDEDGASWTRCTLLAISRALRSL